MSQPSQACLKEGGTLEVVNGGPAESYTLSDLATGQMCQRLGIPVRYYRRLPGELKARVANYDLGRMNGSAYLLRGKGDWVRAFLSTDYVAYDNTWIVETASALLKDPSSDSRRTTLIFVRLFSTDLAKLKEIRFLLMIFDWGSCIISFDMA